MKLIYIWTDSSTCVFLYTRLKYKNYPCIQISWSAATSTLLKKKKHIKIKGPTNSRIYFLKLPEDFLPLGNVKYRLEIDNL